MKLKKIRQFSGLEKKGLHDIFQAYLHCFYKIKRIRKKMFLFQFLLFYYYVSLFCFTEGHSEHSANPPKGAGVSSENNKPQNYSGNTPQQSNIPPPLKSYSAVAAKQNQQFQSQAINNTNNKSRTTRPPGFANSPVAMEGGNPMAAVDNKGSPINQEQLDNAKQQYISNAKQAVAAGNASSPKPAVNQSPMSTTAQPDSKSKATQQLPQQPVIPQQQLQQQLSSSDSVAPKLSYSRMTASKMDQKTEVIQGTTPRGQGELSKFGKVTRIAEGGNNFFL